MASRPPRDDGSPADDPPGDEPPSDPPPPRRLLDGRTLVICALIALIAALGAGLVVSRATADEPDEPAAQAQLTVAETLPDIPLTRFDGSQVSLADYQGQPLVVNFWGSWCQPCVEEMPDLEAVHTSIGEEVTFVGVNLRDQPEAALALAERTGVTYDLVQDPDGELSRALDVTSWPTTLLVLPDGTVVDAIRRKVSAARLCEKINLSLLGGRLEECG